MLSETATPAHGDFSPPRLFISYSRSDGRAFAEAFEERIAAEGLTSWRDLKSVEGGEDIRPQVLRAIETAEHLVLILTRRSLESDWVKREWSHARAQGVKVSPVLGDPKLIRDQLPAWARRADIYDIAELERWAKLVAVLRGPGASRKVPYMEARLPASYVPRSTELKRLKGLVLGPEGGAVGLSTTLSGAGGYGKTTLANALCLDEDVRFEFSDGIIRLEIGRERDGVLGLIADVIEKLDPDDRRPGYTDENVAAGHLSEVLGEARVLLVLDDVWRESQLRPFLLGGPKCVRLVTTRRQGLLPEPCQAVSVDELMTEEALSLLTWGLPASSAATLRPRLAALVDRLEGWAHMLEIANGWLRGRLKRGEQLPAALESFERRLAQRGLTAFDPKNPDARGLAIARCVDASLEDLDEAERERFEELAVIPEDVDAPIETVARFWERTGGLDEDEADDLLERLASLSLLQGLDLGSRTVRLHDNMKWLLRDRMGPERLAAAHGAMADAIVQFADAGWSGLPADDLYGWHFGPGHLRAGGREAEADALLLNYGWIKGRLTAVGAQGLLEAWRPEPEDAEAKVAGRAVALSVPALSQRPEQLPLQLWGRLGRINSSAIAALCAEARSDTEIWGRPRWPGLTPPGAELLRFVGHGDGLVGATFSPDGARVLTCSLDHTARLWDATTGTEIAVLRGHERPVCSAVFSLDGARVLTASLDCTARLWKAETGEEAAVLRGHENSVWSAAFSPDGGRVLTCSSDRTARLWDSATGAETIILRGHEGEVNSATFSPDGARVLTGSDDRTARLWDPESRWVAVFRRHAGSVTNAMFSPDGTRVLTASKDGTARLWDTATRSETAVFRGQKGKIVSAIFSPDGARVLTASGDGTAEVRDVANGTESAVIRGHRNSVGSLVFSPDGARVLTASDDRTVRLWDAATGAETAVLRGHAGGVKTAVFSPDGQRVLTSSKDGTARLWEMEAGTEVALPTSNKRPVTSVEFSLDGAGVLTASLDGTARLWDAETGAEIVVLRGHEGGVLSAVFSPDGARVLTASRDKTARLWDAATAAELVVLRGHKDLVWSAVYSPTGARVLTASWDGTARLWNARTGAEVAVLAGHEDLVWSAVFSLDGARVLTASEDHTARLWDAEAGAVTAVLRGHGGSVRSAVFSPDGTRALTGSWDNTARLWDVATGVETAVLRDHKWPVESVVFSLQGARVLTVSDEDTVRLWDAKTGAEVVRLRGHEGPVKKAIFTQDGAQVLTASDDGTVRFWNAATGMESGCLILDAGVNGLAISTNALAVYDGLGRVHVFNIESS